MDSGSRSIFITGAASGIGKASAKLFAERGWFCGLYDINVPGVEALARELGPDRCVCGGLDVTRSEDWQAAMQSFGAATGGRMDVMFNNAGIGSGGFFEDVPVEVALGIIDVNVKGPVLGVYAALPLLKATSGSVLVNTASVAGMTGIPGSAVYSATKHAVRALTESLSLELERLGIRVCDLMPWFVDTAILDGMNHSVGMDVRTLLTARAETVYPVELAADALWKAVHGKALHLPVGGKAHTIWWKTRFIPGRFRKQLRQNVRRIADAMAQAASARASQKP